MGLDDLVNKAKDLLGQGEAKAQDAADNADAGNTEAAAADANSASGLIDKAKEVLTDERIDQVAGAVQDKTPDNIDSIVDQVAETLHRPPHPLHRRFPRPLRLIAARNETGDHRPHRPDAETRLHRSILSLRSVSLTGTAAAALTRA